MASREKVAKDKDETVKGSEENNSNNNNSKPLSHFMFIGVCHVI